LIRRTILFCTKRAEPTGITPRIQKILYRKHLSMLI